MNDVVNDVRYVLQFLHMILFANFHRKNSRIYIFIYVTGKFEFKKLHVELIDIQAWMRQKKQASETKIPNPRLKWVLG